MRSTLWVVAVAAVMTVTACGGGGGGGTGGGSAGTGGGTSSSGGGTSSSGGGTSSSGGGTSSSGGGTSSSGGGTSATGGGSGTSSVCDAGSDAEITTLPTCSAAAGSTVNVARGCTPNVDGHLHASEWADSTCFNVGSTDMVVYAKYDDHNVYLATSGQPTCGCPMIFFFDPGAASYGVGVFDDPFGTDGDRANYSWSPDAGIGDMGTVPAGIVTACPGSDPTPIRYEWTLPFAAVGVTPGTAHAFKMAIVHADVAWPTGLMVDGQRSPVSESDWGSVSSSSNWH